MRPESYCPVCSSIATVDHGHDPILVAAAVIRNTAIDTAIAVFKSARDAAAKRLKGQAYAEAMRPHEHRLDAAKDQAWSTYRVTAAKAVA